MRRVLLLALLASVTLVRPAAAETASLGTLREAWYATTPLCAVPVGCGSAPTTTSYPENTLHVGALGGQETARTYLSLPPLRGALSGDLILPVADDAGSDAADIASIQVCLVPGGLADPAPAEAPTVDCSVSSDASFLQGSPNYFTADLAPFLSRSAGGVTLAVVPVPATGETWHVAISGRERTTAGAQRITAVLDLGSPITGPTPPEAVPPPPVAPEQPVTAPLPPAAVPDVVAPPAPEVVAPQLPDVAAPQALRPAAFTVEGGRYGTVWALPLGLFLLGWAFVATNRRDLRSYASRGPAGG